MKLLLLILMMMLFPVLSNATEPFDLEGYIFDDVGLINDEQRSQLEHRLANYYEQSHIKIMVMVLESLGNVSSDEFLNAMRSLNQSEARDGLQIVLVAYNEKLIDISADPVLLPDGAKKQLIKELRDYFSKEHYGHGFIWLSDKLIENNHKRMYLSRLNKVKDSQWRWLAIIPICFIVILVLGRGQKRSAVIVFGKNYKIETKENFTQISGDL